MKSVSLKAEARQGTGKAATKKVRKNGLVPAVVYGGNSEPVHVQLDYNPAYKLFTSKFTQIVNVDVDGTSHSTIVKDAQFHPVTDRLLHIDLYRIDEETPTEVLLPIKIEGRSPGVLAGGRLMVVSRKLKVRGIVSQLPDELPISIDGLELGQTIQVKDINIEGVEITSPTSQAIAAVEIPRALRSAAAQGEEGAEGEAAAE